MTKGILRAGPVATACLAGILAAGLASAQGVEGWSPKPPEPQDEGTGITRPPDANPIGIGNPAPPAPDPGPQPAGNMLLASNPAGVAAAMMDAGYKAELTTTDDGYPRIVGRISKSTYWVEFLNCSDQKDDCKTLRFYVGYSLDTPPTLEEINAFNARFYFVDGFLNDDGQPRMDMFLIMRDGGVEKRTFERYLGVWADIMPSFEEAIHF